MVTHIMTYWTNKIQTTENTTLWAGRQNWIRINPTGLVGLPRCNRTTSTESLRLFIFAIHYSQRDSTTCLHDRSTNTRRRCQIIIAVRRVNITILSVRLVLIEEQRQLWGLIAAALTLALWHSDMNHDSNHSQLIICCWSAFAVCGAVASGCSCGWRTLYHTTR